MSIKLIGGSLPGGHTSKAKAGKAEEVGTCVVCKAGIFSSNDHGRAPKPLLGKAHTWCGGVAQ